MEQDKVGRVEALARVLGAAARTRQVIVFTHDDRLPEAVRRLGTPPTVLSVTRRAQSIVNVRQTCDRSGVADIDTPITQAAQTFRHAVEALLLVTATRGPDEEWKSG
jgi:hypothetical protein